MADQIQLRRDTAANWTSSNPTLASGEIGLETDTDQFKVGDGTTAWASLGYGGIQGPQGIQGIQGIQGETGPTGRKVNRVSKVFRVSKARLDHKVHRVNPVKSLPMVYSR